MKQIEAVIQPFKLDDIKEALSATDTHGLTVCAVIGFGGQRERTEPGPQTCIEFLPKIKLKNNRH
jgi:nitrogen regulatory protein PII